MHSMRHVDSNEGGLPHRAGTRERRRVLPRLPLERAVTSPHDELRHRNTGSEISQSHSSFTQNSAAHRFDLPYRLEAAGLERTL